jgi:hypothetical protein
MIMKKTILAVSLAAATGLGVSQNAQADAYAYAYNNIFNLAIVSSTGIIPSSAVFKLTDAATVSGIGSDNNGPVSISSGSAPFNIPDANVGIGSTNSPAANGNIGSNYARGDASIVTSELNPGQPPSVTGTRTSVWAVGESYLNSNANGGGSGTVGSTSTFQFIFGTGTSLTFNFDAFLNLIACVDGPPTCAISNAAFPSNAQASSGVSFVITDTNGAKVFDWAPGTDPTIGNGATASVNPFSLTTNVSRDQNNTGVASISNTTAGGPQFFAQTAIFSPGTYTLSLSDDKRVTTELTNRIPEPDTMALMGLGLLGAFFVNRRKIGTSGKAA